MLPHSGESKSPWMAKKMPEFTALDQDISTEVCIVGAGITGLSTAYMLAKQGKAVIVIDDGPLAGGETERTTAHLSNVIDDRYYELERIHGTAGIKLIRASHTAAIAQIAANIKIENIDCDFKFVDGYLFANTEQTIKKLAKEFTACKAAGFQESSQIEMISQLPLAQGSQLVAALRFTDQAQFHVLKYLNGLCAAILRLNGKLFTNTHMSEIIDGQMPAVKTTAGFMIYAKALVIATNSPISDRLRVHTKQAAYRTYAIAGRVSEDKVVPALYWDMEEPYHYVRTQPLDNSNAQLLIIGGEDHRTGQPPVHDPYEKLADWAKAYFPALNTIEYRWSGQVLETIDGLAFIGHDPAHNAYKNVYIATGDSGMGMTHGTIAGMLIGDLITGQPNSWSDLYEPSRKPLAAALDYVMENAETAIQYLNYFRHPSFASANEIKAGEGAILEEDGKKVAVYKDHQGQIIRLCATCPHAKALVNWNSSEKTWDCPAHGSRFAPDGTVIDGPANKNLDLLGGDLTEQVSPQEYGDNAGLPPPQL